jgi:hypothetical protein
MAMAVFYWMRVYISFQRKRQDPDERRWDLVFNCILALLFTFATIDLIMTIPKIIQILDSIHQLVGG